MTMDGGKVIKSAPVRAKSYSVVAFVLTLLAVLGVVQADDVDAEVVADAITELVAAGALIVARLNVWLRKPAIPPVAPPPH